MPLFTACFDSKTLQIHAATADDVFEEVNTTYNVPVDAIAVYLDNPTPLANSKYGAPMGRSSNAIDPDGFLRATEVEIDEGGYDNGGAYWGLRPSGQTLYCVQDGWGNIAFVDATTEQSAIENFQ